MADTPLREKLREMGLLDLCLAICAKRHVLLVDLLGGVRAGRHRRGTALMQARVELYVYLRSCGFSLPEIGDLCNCDHTTVLSALQKHGPKLAKVVPIESAK